ncbi:hypothetical protein OOT46_25780 [Aquabacterium sp. A7-Y]|uniref:hypothetical protein n=1 Tax=Aquabacterium sp. A7-Y TaxID=1349605 RepID=UPI00223D4C4B|nr:hypothetical protein [Aquabacterium sp. A7-Y]MCW7541225.1 hypothetical protein [Aquabacterium sp. A7-Y]
MRALFSVAALLVVLAVIGVLLKKQMAAVKVPSVTSSDPAASSSQRLPPGEQMRQLQKDLDQAMQQAPRRIDDE